MKQNVIISIQYIFIQENYFSKSGCQVQGLFKNEASSFWAALSTVVSPGLGLPETTSNSVKTYWMKYEYTCTPTEIHIIYLTIINL